MKIASLWRLEGEELELKPELERCHDPELKQRLLGFLRGGGLVLHATALRQDRLDPSRPRAVPLGYLSDGEWIWPLEMTYYLEQHGILPQEEFQAYMRARNYEADEPPAEVLAAAAQMLTGE
ncbi:MAG TPA: hypothetical protein VGW80_04730 [Solirubrobacterales bacterium]|jgi:hypothetical protein|nr:hypothetical protein [Solirubrobacterales bacterium]